MRKTLLVLLVALMAAPASALAEVTREELEEAQQRVREVSAQLEAELTELDQAIGLEDSYKNRVAALEAELVDLEREIQVTELAARERASLLYMSAGTGRLHMLSVDDFGQVGTRDAYLDALEDYEVDVVTKLAFLVEDAARLKVEIEALMREQAIEVSALERHADGIYSRLEVVNAEYQEVYEQWQKQEEERRRREEEERRRREAAAAAAAAAAAGYSSSAGTPTTGRTCPVAGAHSFRDSWLESRPGGRQHHGVDMVAARGTPLVAIESGYIWSMSYHYAGGNGLYIKGNSGDIYYYAHLDGYAPGIATGVSVSVGELVGYVGDTGNATGTPHLHLGYQPGGGPLTNPYQLMVKLCR